MKKKHTRHLVDNKFHGDGTYVGHSYVIFWHFSAVDKYFIEGHFIFVRRHATTPLRSRETIAESLCKKWIKKIMYAGLTVAAKSRITRQHRPEYFWSCVFAPYASISRPPCEESINNEFRPVMRPCSMPHKKKKPPGAVVYQSIYLNKYSKIFMCIFCAHFEILLTL